MQNSFPSPLHEMVVFKLDTKKLQNNLDFLFLHLSDTKSDLSNLKAEFVSDSTQVHTEITELSKLAPKVDLCLEKLDVALALKSKIDSWDSRFRSFEEKLFSIQSLTDDKFKDISLKFDVTINELEDSLNVKFTGQYEELDKFAFENFQRLENILNNEMQKRCTLKEVRDVFKQEARKTLHRSETMGARINFSINDHREIDEDVGLRSKNESDYEYERKLTDSNIDLETRGKSREGNYERQQHTQRNIRKIIKVEKVDSVVSESDESEKFETLESIDKLIIMDGTNQRQYEKSQQKNETINAVISNLDASPVQSRLNPSFSISATAFDNKNVIDYELLAKINDLGDDIYIKIDQINEEIKVVKKILPLKVFTAELEDILSKHNQPVPSPMKTESKDDKLKNLEERLNKM